MTTDRTKLLENHCFSYALQIIYGFEIWTNNLWFWNLDNQYKNIYKDTSVLHTILYTSAVEHKLHLSKCGLPDEFYQMKFVSPWENEEDKCFIRFLYWEILILAGVTQIKGRGGGHHRILAWVPYRSGVHNWILDWVPYRLDSHHSILDWVSHRSGGSPQNIGLSAILIRSSHLNIGLISI